MNLLRTLAKVSSMTMISRILGFVRDAIIARSFGAGNATDAFFVAFKLPNLLRRMFAEGAFAQAFVPIFTEYKQTQSPEATRAFAQHVAGLLSLILFGVTALGIVAAPWVLYASAPGFTTNPDKFSLAVDLLRITFPYIFWISLSSLVGSILNTYHQFTVPAFTPTFLNVAFIVFSVWLAPYFHPPVMALAWAVFVGGLLQLAYQLPYLFKIGFLRWPKLDLKDKAVNRVIRQMGPAVLSVSVAQISLVINTVFASFLQSGSVSWMYYADRLMELPSGVLGAALGTILLPTLSKHATRGDTKEFSALMDWGIRLCLLLTAPAAVGMAVCSFPLVATLFMYNKFGEFDAHMTQQALIAYAFGLVGIILVKILAPGFYAQQNIKTPVKVAILSLVMTQLLNLALVWHLKHAGLALSIGLAACFNAGFLLLLLRIKEIYIPQTPWKPFLLKLTLALAVMATGLTLAQRWLPFDWHARSGWRVLELSGLIVGAILLYFTALGLMGVRARDFRRTEK